MEMKVDIVEFVENEMVELDVAQIGSNWGWGEVGCDYGSDECEDTCGDGYAKKKNFTAYLLPTKLLPLHPLPNQSKPTVPTLSPPLL